MNSELQQLGDIFKKMQPTKPPAYQWQDLALWVITELRIPNFKRNSIFKICKENREQTIRQAVNDTKELCPSGQSWKYFFKIVGNLNKEDQITTTKSTAKTDN